METWDKYKILTDFFFRGKEKDEIGQNLPEIENLKIS